MRWFTRPNGAATCLKCPFDIRIRGAIRLFFVKKG
jgi:hypothetical protein